GGGVHDDAAGGLRQAVALVDGDADAAEEVAEASTECGTARDGPGDVAAECGLELAVDQLVEDEVLDLQGEAGAAVLECLAVLDRDVGGLLEDLALAAVVGLLLRRVVDLLEHAGHREDEVRLEDRELVEQRRQ